MGGPKTKQQTSQSYNNTNTYGYVPGASSTDIDAVRAHEFSHDPRIGYAYSRARQQAHDSYNQPLAGYSTPQLRDASLRASDADSAQAEGQALAEENFNLENMKYGQKMDVAQLTAPRLVNQSSSGTQAGTSTSQTNPGLGGYISQGLSAGSNVVSAMLM